VAETVILCGGKGTRAYPHTVELPKPLLEVAGRPVLRHVMELYASQGHTRFVLAAGYRVELVEEFAASVPAAWDVDVVDTGLDTNTGERLLRCRDRVGDPFFATYADGLANVDLAALEAFHCGHDGVATLTTVPLPSPYGTIEFDRQGRVNRFSEKPRLVDHAINGGFFMFDQSVFEHWEGADLEREILPRLGAAGQLFARRHEGFWKSMDTYKDALELSALASGGSAPWLSPATPASW
jgi:glucose-1-phosphate cytidylyltransferase